MKEFVFLGKEILVVQQAAGDLEVEVDLVLDLERMG